MKARPITARRRSASVVAAAWKKVLAGKMTMEEYNAVCETLRNKKGGKR